MVSITNPIIGTMLPPSTPISVTKRPSYALKRDSSYLDTDDESGLTMSTKKLKVAFDDKVDIRIMEDNWAGGKSMDLIKEEIRVGIERHIAHDDEQYSRLVQIFRQEPFDEDAVGGKLLLKYIIATESKVSRLSGCSELVSAILDTHWLGRDDHFVASYFKFALSLATTHARWLQIILDKTVAYLAYLPSSQGRLPGESLLSRSAMFSRVHRFIEILLRQIPAASTCLIRSLRSNYPNDLATCRAYQQYQRHMLDMCEYASEIKTELMAMIIQKVVDLDVQIQRDIEDLEEEPEEHLLHRHNQGVNEIDDESDAESVSSSEETTTEEEEQIKELRLKVTKLDSTMDLLFDHYDPLVRDGTHADDNEAFQQLLTQFSTFILPNRTRFAQFLLFHFSQISLDHITAFAQQCIEQGFANSASLQRYTAIAYLSSFVARGTHVPRDTVQEIFSILCEYLEQMRKRYEPTCRGPDRGSYALYYSVAQAILYVFCFRWRDLVIDNEAGSEEDDILADQGELTWMPEIKEILQKNIFGLLNPLKVCAPAIVTEFANIARHVRFMEVLSKVESNKRIRLGQTSSYYGLGGGLDVGRRETVLDRKGGDARHQLGSYFPFDPYNLPYSKGWLQNDYNEWRLPRDMRRDDDEETYYDETDEDSDDESIEGVNDGVSLEVLSNSS